MANVMQRLRSLFGRGDANRTTRDAKTKDEDRAIESVEADMVHSRDDAFSRMAGMPGSGDDQRR